MELIEMVIWVEFVIKENGLQRNNLLFTKAVDKNVVYYIRATISTRSLYTHLLPRNQSRSLEIGCTQGVRTEAIFV